MIFTANTMSRYPHSYDSVGNRTTVAENTTNTTSYSANNLNQYTAVGGGSLTYDGNGNLLTQNGWTYAYDAQSRLLTAGSGLTTASFAYDARNRCVQRTINGMTTFFYFDGWDLIEEHGALDAELAHYLHGATVDELLVKVTSVAGHYYHHDALGSVTQLTDATGGVAEQYSYDTFGGVTIKNGLGVVIATSAVGNRFLFTGREFIAELALYDYRNRVFSPGLGRFLQTDPIRFSGGDVDLYRYVGNNPVNRRDPLGLQGNYYGPQNDVYQATSPSAPSSQPQLPVAKFVGAEAHFFGGGGVTRVTCCDENCDKRIMWFSKVCFGGAAGFGVGGGAVAGLSGTNCRGTRYSGWFYEAGGGIGPVSGGVDVGYTDEGAFSGVVEGGAGIGRGLPGLSVKSTWCRYFLLSETIIKGGCK